MYQQRKISRAIALSLGMTAGAIALPALAMPTLVTNGNDMGEGSLRAALEGGAREVLIATDVAEIMIMSPLVYGSDKPLVIYGNGQSVMALGDHNLLELSNGADLTVVGLSFVGPGGFSIEDQSGSDAPGKGIFIDVRDDQRGQVNLVLDDVTVRDVANHGVHVSDCDIADNCGGGAGGEGDGSDASISVVFNNVTIDNVGNGKFDADGLRVDERGRGSIKFSATGSVFTRVGADGVELDENQNGVVIANVTDSQFTDNGNYCNPDLLQPQLDAFLDGADEEGEFDQGELAMAPGPVGGTLDDACFEYEVDLYDDGSVEAYEYAIDVDDGFDIDEAGNGFIKLNARGMAITGNLDEGLDLDEAGNGGVVMMLVDSSAAMNADDGFKVSEEDNGAVNAALFAVTSENNGGKGVVLEEADNGPLSAQVTATTTAGNDDEDDTGLELVQEDNGSGILILTNSDITDGIDLDGVEQ